MNADTLYLTRLSHLADMAHKTSRARDEAIRGAYALGVPVPKIAEAAGVTRSRIYQVLRKEQ